MNFLKKIFNIIVFIFLAYTSLYLSVFLYIRYLWPNATYEQIIMTIRDVSPRVMANNITVIDYVLAFLFFVVVYPICCFYLNTKCKIIATLIIGLTASYTSGFLTYQYHQLTTSSLYEENYISPDKLDILFPQPKRNLVLIYLESFEQNFAFAEHYNKNLIPNLSLLQKDGQYSLQHNTFPGTNYSIAALVSSQCGIPLRYLEKRNLREAQLFLPQAICLPEILRQNDYQTALVKASDISFTNVDIYAYTHGFDSAEGSIEILKNYPKNERVKHLGTFGGVNDATLFDYAKKKLQMFSPEKPFMLTLFSLDTHTPTPYYSSTCNRTFNDLRDTFMCTDSTVSDFIDWLKSSPYWENTTVIIVGDHLLPLRIKAIGSPHRGIYNVFLNLPENLVINSQKIFSTFDLAPTILESIGVTLKPRAFGLGRSLFAQEPTLTETKGIDKFYTLLLQKSKIYNKFSDPMVKNPY